MKKLYLFLFGLTLMAVFFVFIVSMNEKKNFFTNNKNDIKELIENNRFETASNELDKINSNTIRDSLSTLFRQKRNEFIKNRLPELLKKKRLLTSRNHLHEDIDTYEIRDDLITIISTTRYYRPRKKLEFEPFIEFGFDNDKYLQISIRTKLENYSWYRLTCDDKVYEGKMLPSSKYYTNDVLNMLKSIIKADKNSIWYQPYYEERNLTKLEFNAVRDVLELYSILEEMLHAGFLELSKN